VEAPGAGFAHVIQRAAVEHRLVQPAELRRILELDREERARGVGYDRTRARRRSDVSRRGRGGLSSDPGRQKDEGAEGECACESERHGGPTVKGEGCGEYASADITRAGGSEQAHANG